MNPTAAARYVPATTADAAATGTPAPTTTGLGRRVPRAVAILSCLPYISLKTAWMTGHRVGIPHGSRLREPGEQGMLITVNGLSVLMDGAVVVLALVLTRPWGGRVPSWPLVLPVWAACGLLAPIMAGFPAQLLVSALGPGAGEHHAAEQDVFLAEWVFRVVYGGFILQGLALGALFVLYARERWGRLWRGRLGDLAPGAAARPVPTLTAVTTAVPCLAFATVHLMWACGGTAGLSEGRIEDRGSDFSVLEAVYVLFALATAAGVLLLAFRLRPSVPVRVPLALVWIGSGALGCWGGWLTLAGLTAEPGGPHAPTSFMSALYAAQLGLGALVVVTGARWLTARGAALAARRPRPHGPERRIP